MSLVYPPKKSVQSSPAARRGRWVWVAGAGVVVVVAAGGWLLVRDRARADERAAALAAAYDQAPNAGERLMACLARDPDDVQVLETLVVWSLRADLPFDRLEPYFDRLCELKPTDPSAWQTRANQRIRAGRIAEGIADGLRAHELDPGNSEILELIASTAMGCGNPMLAVQVLDSGLKSFPSPPDNLTTLLVKSNLQAGDVGGAERTLDRYFPARRADAQSILLRGLILQSRGRHAEAVSLLSAAVRSPEQRCAALFAQARSLSALGREDEARQAFDELDRAQARERAVLDAKQRPNDLAAQVRAAEAHLADGKPSEAAELLGRATAALGGSPEAMSVLARAFRQLGREDLARKCEQTRP